VDDGRTDVGVVGEEAVDARVEVGPQLAREVPRVARTQELPQDLTISEMPGEDVPRSVS
jgi:hypothetical protein